MSSESIAGVWKHCPKLLRKPARNQRWLKKMPRCWPQTKNPPKTDAEKKLTDLRLENVQLEKQMASISIHALTQETDLALGLETVLNAELELAEKQLERLEQEPQLYTKA
jgi:hypothetical protein